jgi:hypothetical protein
VGEGLCYFVRHNHDGDRAQAASEPYGLDAFLLYGRAARWLPDTLLSMGAPWWDYWLVHAFIRAGRPVQAVEFPAAFHRSHPRNWSSDAWHRGSSSIA